MNGKSLEIDGKQIIQSSKPVPWVMVSFDAAGMAAYTGSSQPDLSFPAARGRKVTITNTRCDEQLAR